MTAQAETVIVHVLVREMAGRLLVSWRTSDPAVFGAMKDDLRASFPRHSELLWNASERAWSLPGNLRGRLQEWAASWTSDGDDTCTWEQEPHQQRHQAREKGPRQARAGRSAGLEAAYRTLHLRKSVPPALVRATRRALAGVHHSDLHGGSDEAMAAVNAAVDAILAALEPATRG